MRLRAGRLTSLFIALALAACQRDATAPAPKPLAVASVAQALPSGCSARPCVLVVDDDRGHNEQSEWSAALTAAGITNTVSSPVSWGTTCGTDGAPGNLPALAGWDLVFWETGAEAWTNVSATNQTDAINYLTSAPGGRLVLAGMHIFYSEPSAATLYGTYIGGTSNYMTTSPWTAAGGTDELCAAKTYTVNTTASAGVCWTNMGSMWNVQSGAIGCGAGSGATAGKYFISKHEVLTGVPYRTAMYGFDPGQLATADLNDLMVRMKGWIFRPINVSAGGPYACLTGVPCALSAAGADVTQLPLTFSWDMNNNGLYGESGEPTVQSPGYTFSSPGTFTIGINVANAYSNLAATTTVTVTNPVPQQFTFTSAPQTVTAGNCSSAVTVQSQDNSGNPANVGAATTVNLASTSTGNTFYSNSTCTTAVSSVSIAAGTNTATFYFKDTRSGSPTLTASGSLTSDNQVETILAGAASRVAFTSLAQSLTAGSCSAITNLQSQDGFGNAANVGSSTAISLSSTSGGGTFYSNSTCTTVATTATIAAGTSGTSFYFKDNTAGTPTLTASFTGWTSGTQVETISAGAASRVGFTTGAQSVAAGACSAITNVQSQDGFGNVSNVGVATAVSLSSSSGTGGFYSDSGCTAAIGSTTIGAGGNTASFYFKDSTAGTPTLTASVAGWTQGTQVETISAGGASRVAFTTLAQTLPAGGCSGVTTVQSRDALNNPANVGAATTVNLSSTSGGNTFYSNSSCTTVVTFVTLAAGTNTQSFYFKDTRSGSPTLTAAVTGWTSGTQVETINPAAPSKVLFISGAQTVPAGSCSLVTTVQSQDAFNNVSNVGAATAVNLSSSSGGGTFYSNSSCTTAIASVTLAAGTSSAGFYFKDTTAGSPTLTASVAGWTSGTQVETITAAGASKLAFTSAAKSLTAGACSSQVTLQSQDNFGNPANVGTSTSVSLASTSGANTFYSDPSCLTVIAGVTIAAGSNSAGYYFKDNNSGTPTQTLTATGFTGATQIETVSAGAPTRLAFSTAPQTHSAGSCSSITTIQSRDGFNNPSNVAATTTVTLTSSSGTTTFYSDAACTSAVGSITLPLGGNVSSFYFKDTTAGSPTLTAAASGLTSGTQVETITAAAANRLVFVTTAQTLLAGACSALTTIQSQDSVGNPANVGANTTVTLTTTSSGGSFYSDATCTTGIGSATIVTGTSSTSFYWKDTRSGTPTLTGASAGFTSGNQGETINPAAASKLAFQSSAQTLTAGNCSAITTVQSTDAFNNVSNVASATTVNLSSTSTGGSFYSNSSCTTSITSATIAAASSGTTFYWKDTRAGAPTLTAAAAGFTSATQVQTVNSGAASKVAITTGAATVTAGVCAPLTSVQSQDSLNNPANVGAATAVSLTSSSTGGTFYSDAACTAAIASVTISAGTNAAGFYWKDTRSGTPTLTVSAAGLASGTQVQTVNAAAPVNLVFTSTAQTLQAGACSGQATTTTQDAFGNLSQVTTTTTLNYSAAPATVTFYSDSACTSVVTTQTMATGTANRNFFFRSNTAGTPTLTVSAAGFSSATQVETITSASAAKLAITTPSRTVTAGACSLVLTVQSQDSFNNPANVGSSTAVNLGDSSGAGTFYSDSTCTTAVGSVSIAAGTNTQSFYFKDTLAGAPTLTTSAAGLTSGTQVETVTAAVATALAFATGAQSVGAGTCSLAATAQTRDSFGNASNVGAAVTVNLASTSGGNTFYSNSTCTTVASNVSVAAGTSSAQFWWKDNNAGTPTLTLSATGFTSATQVQTVTAGSAARLAFTTPSRTVTAGACSAVLTAQTQDALGNPVNVGAATTVALASTSGGNTFYSDSTCTTAVGSVSIAAGTNTQSFYFKDTVAGAPTLTVSSAGLTSSTQAQTVNAGNASRLVFLNAPVTVTAGSCSTALTAQRQDAFGNPTTAGGALTVTLSSSSGNNTFYSDAACGSVAASVSISAGQTNATFYLKDTRAGTPTETISATGLSSATQVETINAGAATVLVFTSAAQTVPAGNCSGAATLQTRDAFGNAANAGAALTVNLSSTSGTTTFSANACSTTTASITIAAGTSSGTFYFKDTTIGSPTLTASAAGFSSAAQAQSITAASVTALAFTTGAQTLSAGGCSLATTVQSRDAFNNAAPVSSTTSVSLSSTSTGASFYSDASCTTAVASVTIATGSSAATFYWKDTKSGSPTLTAASAGLTSATQLQTVNAGAVVKVAFANAPVTVTAGSCSGALLLQTQDTFGNPSNVGASTTISLSSSSGTTSFFVNNTCGTSGASVTLAAGTNSGNLWFKDNTAGTPTLTAASAGLTSGTQLETVQAGAPNKVAFTSGAQTITAGACSAITSVQIRDALNNPSNVGAATPVTLSSTSGGGTFYSDPACTTAITQTSVPAGNSAASFYFKDTVAGSPTLTAAATGLTSGTQVETISSAAASKLVFTTAAQSRTAGTCSLVATVQSQDNSGNPSNVGVATTVNLSSTSGGGTFYSNSTCTTQVGSTSIAAGTSTASFYWKDTVAGTPTLTASATGFTSGNQTQTVTAAAATALVFTTAAQTRTAGTCSAVTSLQTNDPFGNGSNVATSTAVSLSSNSAGGTFYSDSACTAAIAGVTIAAGTRTASFYWKDTRSGTPTLTASATGFTSATQVQTVNPAAPSKLVFLTGAQTVTAGGCSGAVTVQSQDAFGNASNVGAATGVNLSSTSTGGTFYSAAGCSGAISSVTLAAGGNSATFYFKDTRSGTPTLTASAAGFTSATQVETVNAAAASVFVFTTSSQTLNAGTCSAAVTVRSQDAFGNLANVGAATQFDLGSTSLGGSFFSDPACGSAILGGTINAGQSSAVFYFNDTRAGSPTITASQTGWTAANQVETISAAAPSLLAFINAPVTLTAGGCSSALTVQTQDAFGNPSPVGALTSVTLGTNSPQGSFYQTGTCGTVTGTVSVPAGQSTATVFYGDTRSGTSTLTASATGFSSGSQVATVNSGAATRLAFSSAPQSLTAGVCSAAATVQARDGFNNPANVGASTTVALSSTSTGNTFSAVAGCGSTVTSVTMAAGTNSVTIYWKDTRAGTPTLTAAAAGLSSGTQAQTVSAAAASKLVFLSAPQTLTAGACSAVTTVQTQDPFSNPSNLGASTAFSLASSSTGGTFYSDSTCTTLAGTSTVVAGANTTSFYFKDTRSGSPTLTVSGGALTAATQTQTITSASPTKLAFVSAPQSLIAGNCSAAATVQSQDGFNNPSAVAAATSVALSNTSSGGSFYSDAACTTAIAATNIPAGANSATFFFKDTRTGTPTLTTSAAGLTAATQIETINPAAANKLVFLTAPVTVAAGACSAVLTVQAQDAFGNAVNLGAATSVGLTTTSPAGGAFFSDPACGTGIGSGTIVAGTSTANFYYRDSTAGSPTLTATVAGLTNATQVETVNAAAPSKLVFTSAPQTLVAGNCSGAANLRTQDAFNNTANVGSATSVALSSTSTGASFYTDAACTLAAASVTIGAGTSSQTFFFKDTRTGTPTLTAAATGLTSATQVETINAAAASKLAFTSAPQTLTAGNCSLAAALQSQDSFGNPANVAAATTVNLSTTSTAGAFYSDAACTNLVTNVSVAAGTSAAGFFFKDTRAGAPTLTSAAAGLTSATQVETINAAAASRLAFTSLSQSLTAGSCSAISNLQTQDAFGNPSNVGATTVNLSSGSATLKFWSNASCTTQVTTAGIPAGTNATGFYFSDTTAGSPTLTAAAAGLANATQVETINPAAAAKLVFTNPPRTVTAGTCSAALTLQSQDNLGNPSNVTVGTAVALATSSTGGTFYSDATCTTAASSVTLTAGTNTVSAYFKDTVAGAPTLSATASGFTTGVQVQTVTAAAPAALAFVTAAQSLTAGNCSAQVTLRSQDVFANPSSVAAATTVSLSSTSSGGTFYSDASCTTAAPSTTLAAGASTATFYFKDTQAGSPTLTLAATGLTSATQVETISAGTVSKLVFISAAQTVTAGACSLVNNLQSQDVNGNPANVAAATSVALSTTSSGGSFYSDAACTTSIASATIGAGAQSASFYFKDTRAGGPTLTAAATGLTSATQVETINAAAPAKLVFTTSSQTLQAGACSGVATLQTQDAFNNPSNVAGAVTVNLSSTSTGGTFSAAAGCAANVTSVSLPAGSSTVSFFFKDTRTGSPTLTASATGLTSATQGETITNAVASKLIFTSPSRTLVAGACSPATTLQTQDAFGNVAPVAGATTVNLTSTSTGGTFYLDSACATATASISVAAASSSGTFYFKDTRAGSPTLTAAAASFTSGTQVETITASSPAKLAITTGAQTVTAGNCSLVTQVQSQDTFGNAANVAAATTVNLTTSSATGAFYSNSTCTTVITSTSIAAAGNSASFYFRDTTSGSPTLTASATGLTSATQVETINAAAPNKLVITSAPQTISAGACSAAVTVQARDSFNNPSNVAPALTVTLSSTSGTLTFSSAAGCATGTTTVNIAAGTSSTTFFFKDTVAGSRTLTASATGLTAATQTATINAAAPSNLVFTSAAQTLLAGACSAVTSLQTRDAFANPSNVTSTTTVNLTSTSTGGGFFTDSTCLSAVTSVAIATGTNAVSLYFKDTRTGTPTLTAAATGLTSATQVETINAAPATVLAFTTPSRTATAGVCSPIVSIQSRDAFGNVSNVPGSTTVALSSSSAAGTFYSDASCTTLVSSVAIAAGGNGASFYFKDTVSGSPTVTLAAAGFTSGTQVETINPAAANRLAFLTPPQTLAAGACSALTTVGSQDSFGNASPVGAATTVTLTTTGTGAFYSDAACTAAVGTRSIAAGTSSTSFYFRYTVAGSPVATAAAAGFTSATQTNTIGSATVSKLAFITPAKTLGAGACSTVVTVQTQDAFGNAANVGSSILVTLSSSSPAGSFYADPSCGSPVAAVTVVIGTSSASFYYQDTQAGASTATATSPGLTTATQVETINPGGAARVAFTTAPQTVTAGSCSAGASVQVQDAFGNPAPVAALTAVQLSSSSPTGTFSPAAGCGSTVSSVNLSAGQSTATFFFRDPSAGTPTLTATVSGLSAGTQVETISVAAASKLAFVTPAPTVTVGACSPVMTVAAQDASGNDSPVAAATNVTLTSTSGGGTYYSDAACTTQIAAASIAAGTARISFYYKDTTVGAPTLTASSAPLTPATQVATINGTGSAARLFITTAQQNVVAGACSALTTVQSQDSFGNPVNVTAATQVALSSSSGTGGFFTDPACTNAGTTLTIAAGGNTASFYFKDTKAGTPTLTAATAGLTNATQVETIRPGAPAALAYVTVAQTIPASACSGAITVRTQDTLANPSPVAATTAVGLSTTSGGGAFFSDATCSTGIASATLASGATTTTFYYRDTMSGAPMLTASSAGLTSAKQTETITAGAQAALAFVTQPQTVTAGGCSALAQVQMRDALGNPSPVAAATVIALSSTSTGGTFYSDPVCNTAITSKTLAAGASTTSFYFKDTLVGAPTLTASAAGVTNATQAETILPGAASALAITTAPITVTAGACSAVITAEARDPLGNTAAVTSATSVVPSSSSNAATFYSDPACANAVAAVVIPAGQSTADFYYRDTLAGAPMVTMSNPGLTSATQTETVGPDVPAKVAFSSAPQTLQVATCSAVATLETRDQYDNVSPLAADTMVALVSSSATGSFYVDSNCTTSTTTVTVVGATSGASFYFKDTMAGSATLSATASGLAPGNQVETFGAGAAVNLAFANLPRTVAAGACSQAVTLESRDAQDNPTQVTANQLIALTSSATTTTFYADGTCTTMVTQVTLASGTGSVDFYFKDSKLGAPMVTATNATLGSATQVENVVGSAPSKLAFAVPAVTATAGLCSPPLSVETHDSFDNLTPAMADVPLLLSSSSASMQFFSDGSCTTPLTGATIAAGNTSTVVYFSDTLAGMPKVTAKSAGLADGTQTETVLPAAATHIVFASAVQNVPTRVCSAPAVVQLQDALSNPAPASAPVSVALTSTSSTLKFFSDSTCTTAATSATVTAGANHVDVFFSDTMAGSATITATTTSLGNATQMATFFNSGPPVALGFGTPALTLEAGVCSPAITVEAQDMTGATSLLSQPADVKLTLGSTVAALYADPTCTTQVTQLTIPANGYRITFYLKDAVVEPVTINAAATGLTGASQTETLICPATTDGAYCDDGDLCNGRETCQAGACTSNAPPSCDDNDPCTTDSCDMQQGCVNAVTMSCCRAPGIAHDGNPVAAVNVPYRYSATNLPVLTKGTGTIAWAACPGAPAGFRVDATTGFIDWTPQTAGATQVCLQATGSCGTDTYSWMVNVAASAGPLPTANIVLPMTTMVNTATQASAMGSTPDPAFAYEWSFGDGTPVVNGSNVSHSWALAGGYNVHLKVFDAFGQLAETGAAIAVTDATCTMPPSVTIQADKTRGTDSLKVMLMANFHGTDPHPVYRWDLGDGTTMVGAMVEHTFTAGSYVVNLEVVTNQGCAAHDSVTIDVTGAGNTSPHCAVTATPQAGPAPLAVTWGAVFGDADGAVTSATWFFSDGVTSNAMTGGGAVMRMLDRPGVLSARLEVVDDHGALCRATVTAEAGNAQSVFPPEIVSVPTLTAECGKPYTYGDDGVARATGSRPLSWSLGKGDANKPKGMTIDDSGAIAWTPAKAPEHTEKVTVVAQNAAGSVEQDFEVKVSCPQASGCGCGTAPTGSLAMFGLGLLALVARRRKATSLQTQESRPKK